MSVCPKGESSKGHRDQRRASWKMDVVNLVEYLRCGGLMMSYRVCKNCRTYDKKEIAKVADWAFLPAKQCMNRSG